MTSFVYQTSKKPRDGLIYAISLGELGRNCVHSRLLKAKPLKVRLEPSTSVYKALVCLGEALSQLSIPNALQLRHRSEGGLRVTGHHVYKSYRLASGAASPGHSALVYAVNELSAR